MRRRVGAHFVRPEVGDQLALLGNLELDVLDEELVALCLRGLLQLLLHGR